MADERYDAVVVGVGGHGSAALYHLANRGLKVLGLEQYSVAHNKGSSHGLSRIIRLAYFEDPAYVPLLKRAYELWRELEDRTKSELLTVTGGLDIGDASRTDTTNLDRATLAVQQHNIRHEVLSAAEVHARFPGYQLPQQFKALYQADAGILAPERCIQAHVEAAMSCGAVLQHCKVLGWRTDESTGDVVVECDGITFRAGKLVISNGAWIDQLVPELKGFTKVERQVVGWFDVSNPKHFSPQNFPIFILEDEMGAWYGFPSLDDAGFKIGLFSHLKELANPDEQDRAVYPADEELLRKAVKKYWPEANGKLLRAVTCMFTNTPDNHFLIDVHPVHSQVVMCSACSGHGFKFCSVIGEILADLVQNGATKLDIDFLRIQDKREGHAQLLQKFMRGRSKF